MFDLPYMIAVDNKVEKVNGHYLDLTGYKEMDILGREVEEVWRQLLRISADLSKLQHSKSCDCYMFDICFEAKEVTISYSEDIELKQGVYTFRQKKNSILEDKFPFLMLANSANDTGTALYSVPDFILLKANEYHHRYCRKRNTGLKSIIGKYIWDIFPDWKDSETSYIFNEAAETGKPVFSDEYMRVYPEIGNICIKYTLTPIFEEETVKYIVLIHEDVTEKVKIRDAIAEKNRIIEEQKSCLQSQRDYMYKLFNAMELPIMSLSYPELKIIEFNKKALSELREFTGMGDVVAESYLAGRSLYEMISLLNIQDEKEFFDRMKQTRCTVCHEKMEIEKNGRKVYYNITYHPFLDIMGEIVQLLIVGVDVTREVEKRKQIEEVLKLKDEFLYFMTHEFKTPLTVINAAVQTLEYVYSKQIPDKAIVLVEKVKQNSYRQLRLVNNLLEIARINSGNIKLKERNIDIVFLARAITESVAIYAQQKDIDIVFISKLPHKVVGLDDEKFERILLNLLSNAIKFTPAGRKVKVELSSRLHKNRRMVCIKVEDQGIGIPKGKQDIIFNQFGQVDSLLTRQAEGSGIGLYLVKTMVNSLGGDIALESESGKGTVFTLMIPSKKVKENIEEEEFKHISDSRLVQSIAIEFSDIYI